MSLTNSETQDRLAGYLAGAFGAAVVRLSNLKPLSGGAIQENWAIDLEIDGGARAGRIEAVLRTDSPSSVGVSHGRREEFALLSAAWDAGVTVPEPLHLSTDLDVIGKPFVLMRRVDGTAVGPKVAKDLSLGGDREALTERLGRELARIHSITPNTHRFDFLPEPDTDAGRAELATMRRFLDETGWRRPVLEWSFRWLERHCPPPAEVVLAHHDFRTGNYMIDGDGLTAILDWEFAGWSDPHEDLAWFCAICWRFSRRDLEAGGIGSRDAFYRGYSRESGREIDPVRIAFWEVYAHLRWAVIAIQQGKRYLSGGEKTLDLGLTGRRLPELEFELLRLTAPERTP